jgi:hypothetical protein
LPAFKYGSNPLASDTFTFLSSDLPATLFPLKTNRLLAEVHGQEISDYINKRVLNDAFSEDSFLPQQKVFATKPKGHLRRTVKLDPVAEYFVYDLCFRNRKAFRPEVSKARRSFGYRFVGGKQIPVHVAYSEYKGALKLNAIKFKHNIQFDIAAYFNSIYHHDICHWFSALTGVSSADGDAASQFFREINAGRSIDFLPHGIYPCKMLGNEFLKFVDLTGTLKSKVIVRFMDDFTLFDDDAVVLQQDFARIQQLLGQVALNVNPSKTYFDNKVGDVQQHLTELQQSLTEITIDYEPIATPSGVDFVETEVEIEKSLSAEQVQALIGLLKSEALEESDADLILVFLRTHTESVLELMPILLEKFPNLIKQIYAVCAHVPDKKGLSNVILDFLKTHSFFLEYQLFWLAAIVEDHLLGYGSYGSIMLKLYELTGEMKIARAKVLETPEQGFGFKEIRDGLLKTGQSDWLSWSSAVGARSLKTAERNYVLGYFSKGSPMNGLIASGVKKM